MTQLIAKYAAKKMLSSEMNKYKSKEVKDPYDPFYQMIPHPRKEGKFKKVKKQVPAYIPSKDADILARARKSAYRLDFCLFNFLGLRFGWSSVIGLIPAAGDVIDTLLALQLIRRMTKIERGLPQGILIKMIVNLIIDFVVGLVPFIGDLADAAIKCNSKNVRLLEEHLDSVYKPRDVIAAEKNMQKNARPQPATVFEDFSDEEEERGIIVNDERDRVRQPARAYSGRRDRISDEEMGMPRHDTHRSHKDKPSRNNTKSSRRH